MLGIVVALPVECGTLLPGNHARVGQTLPMGPGIVLRISGMGSFRAVAAATALRREGAKAILSWGCSAALKPELAAGRLLLPDTFITPEGDRVTPDHLWWRRLHRCLTEAFGPITAPLAGTDQILATPSERHTLQRESGAYAADMESAFLARWAYQQGLPFVAIRSVSDCADLALPDAIHVSANTQGDIDRLKLVAHIARHPGEIPALIKLGKQFRSAHRRLTQVTTLLHSQTFCLPC